MKIYETIVGSRLYKTNSETSDHDSISIYIPEDPIKLFCIRSGWNDAVHKSLGQEDSKSYDLRYFAHLAMTGQTAILESLFADESDTIQIDEIFRPIYCNRNKFLISQMSIVGPACGYAHSEYKTSLGETTGNLGVARKETLSEFGFSPKNAHHCLRILAQTLFALQSGTYSPYPDDHAPVALDIAGVHDWKTELINLKFGKKDRSWFVLVFDLLFKELQKYHVQYAKEPKLSPFSPNKDIAKVDYVNDLIGATLLKSMEKKNGNI